MIVQQINTYEWYGKTLNLAFPYHAALLICHPPVNMWFMCYVFLGVSQVASTTDFLSENMYMKQIWQVSGRAVIDERSHSQFEWAPFTSGVMAERGTSTGYLVISFSLLKLIQLRRTKIKSIYSILVTTAKSLDNIPVNTVFILAFIWHFVPALFPVSARAKRSSDAGVQIEIENALSYKQGPFLHVLSLCQRVIYHVYIS